MLDTIYSYAGCCFNNKFKILKLFILFNYFNITKYYQQQIGRGKSIPMRVKKKHILKLCQ